MKTYLAILFLFLPIVSSAQRPAFTVSTSSLSMGDCPTATTCTTTFTVNNSGSVSASINLEGASAPFSASPTTFTLAIGASQTVTVSFNPTYNLTYKNVLIIDATNGLLPKSVSVTARGKYTDASNYYVGTEDLWGETLRTALWNKIKNNTNTSYNNSRDEMFSLRVDAYDFDGTNRKLECVYSGRVTTLSTTRPVVTSPNYMNTEHTWPQSLFGTTSYFSGGTNIPESDIHHLYPTDADANAERGNYPFANVANRTVSTTWCHDWDAPAQDHVCTTNVGTDYWSYFDDTANVYEVRNVQRGNSARSMFYMVTRYGNMSSFYTAAQELVLKTWHNADLPNTKEVARNTAIQNFQNNRNPYVDHPDFVDRIGSFVGTYASAPISTVANVFPPAEVFGNALVNTTLDAEILVANRGTESFTINSASVDNPAFSVVSFKTMATPVAANQVATVLVRFNPTANQSYSGTLSVNTTAGTLSTTLNGVGVLTLPINLMSATATQENGKITLKWKSIDGDTADYFEVERKSATNQNFESIGNIKSTGNAFTVSEYQFTTDAYVGGLHEYRIKMVEKNGVTHFSAPLQVLVESPTNYSLSAAYPNPFQTQSTLQFSVATTQMVRIILIDALGRKVSTIYEGIVPSNQIQQYQVEGANLPNGSYWITAEGENFKGIQKIQIIR